ncbi:MAG: MOSC domain-containing protein [Anaerolineales bacterium]|nr:MOSC domain-containing protein [Anaerolineales bacterium]
MLPKLISLNLGRPEVVTYFGKEVQTGGRKSPVAEAFLRRVGFEGDGQADLKNHGGPDKAACVYAFDHYPFWEARLGRPLTPGAFSENLTTGGLLESEVCIGDVFRLGGARVQVSQPRQPCSKLAGRFNRRELPEEIHATGFSGFYVRVLDEGLVRAGDSIELLERDPAGVTVQFINELLYRKRTDAASFERALSVAALSEAGRAALLKRLATSR